MFDRGEDKVFSFCCDVFKLFVKVSFRIKRIKKINIKGSNKIKVWKYCSNLEMIY